MKFKSFSLVLILGAVAGCSPSSGPPVVGSAYTPTSDFGYILNGVSFDRNSSPIPTQAYAIMDPNGGSGNGFLQIHLQSFPPVGLYYHSLSIDISVSLNNPRANTYSIGWWGIPAGAMVTIDTSQYQALDSGTLTITKFDTINNVISGTFTFSASLVSPTANSAITETVTSGFFTNVSVYGTNYNRGSITAEANRASFPANFTTPETIAAFIQSGTSLLVIQAVDVSSDIEKVLQVSVSQPAIGTFPLIPSLTSSIPAASYYTYGGSPDVSISTQSGASGELTITQFDTAAHRISGTFHFSGPDASTGHTIQITGGVIDSVQWSVL